MTGIQDLDSKSQTKILKKGKILRNLENFSNSPEKRIFWNSVGSSTSVPDITVTGEAEEIEGDDHSEEMHIIMRLGVTKYKL